jgi:vacuolar-type H+-ATPase subunit I/STV1
LKKVQTALDSANSILEQGDASLASVRKTHEETADKHAAELSAVNTELNEERYVFLLRLPSCSGFVCDCASFVPYCLIVCLIFFLI